MRRWALSGACLWACTCLATAADWLLPTINRGLYAGDYPGFYMYVPRNWEGKAYQVWQGGQYGFVRSPVKSLGEVLYMKFHEGVDIRPLRRDSRGDPLDVVWSTAPGVVAHVNPVTRASSYGKYVVVEHQCPDGAYYSLYAHLTRATVEKGQPVRAGTPLGDLGYTGPGLNRERAHLHFEINLLLEDHFNHWHGTIDGSGNPHGVHNGLNLAGIPVADFLLAQRANPGLLIQDFLSGRKPHFKVTVPKAGSRLEIRKRYPWLLKDNDPASNAWEISFEGTGVPLAIRGVQSSAAGPELTWVAETKHPHTYLTRKRLTGVGANAKLSRSGLRYINLVAGRFSVAPPKPPTPEMKP